MERLDGSVRRALRGAGVPDAGVLAAVTRAWPGAVGPAIARAAWPQRLARDGTLHVTTVSSTWAFELGRMAEEIEAKLQGDAGRCDAACACASRPAPCRQPAPRRNPFRETSSGRRRTRRRRHRSAPGSPTRSSARAVRRAVAASLAAARDDRGV